MEFVEYVPGAMAAGWMVFRIVILLRHGQAQIADDKQSA